MEQQIKQAIILLVDDDESNLKLLEAMLFSNDYVVRSATGGREALASVEEQLPDLILLDIMMPDIDGFEVMRRLKASPRTCLIPIILITALKDRDLRIKSLDEGGTEFLSKPVERAELLIRVKNVLKVKEYQDFLLSHNATLDERIQWLAHFDALTGLPNRALINDRANFAIRMARRRHVQLAIMYLDLDHFKNVNDSLGHDIGDKLLKKMAECLKSLVREQDTLSRQGGDEFILVLPDTNANGAARLAERLLEAVAQRFQVDQYVLSITTSIGISMFPDNGEDFESLCKNADIAMYRAKSDGRNSYQFFTQEMQRNSARILQLESALRQALEYKQMYLHFQPQMSLSDNKIIGAEALLRWNHPEFGMVSPTEFIPIAESDGQILKIGEWVLRMAVQQLKLWFDRGLAPMVIAVNLSAVQFRNPHLPELVAEILEESKLPPQYLELELTESAAMSDPGAAITVINKLHKLGIRMVIDDFGTGFSSLSYFKKFKVYKLKIAQSFVSNLSKSSEDKAIIVAIINLAHSLNMRTIAEGVETKAQFSFLCKNGCNELQGFYYSKPLSADQFEKFVQRKSKI